MLTIIFQNDLMINVGYIKRKNTYFITVVLEVSIEGWKSPIELVEVHSKESLIDEI
ncbi:hypothetical protein JYG23_04255 [Sedimentibacter sp. zth1]|uniref:hypothetical protein n=1 Tax=Sedimentibacter sp. zth1 TaxID=2816908 RepID=UPI001A90FB02|nr:hypothetical protein [Sedimentibacter sp. zth1]QSX06674.1 hypothetical protein JYG23_04255 [Sedimentibacter sp. zth1]